MSKIDGLLDALEATVLEGQRIPLTGKVVLEVDKVLSLLDKVRLTVKSSGGVVESNVDVKRKSQLEMLKSADVSVSNEDLQQAHSFIDQARQDASKIKKGSNEYADYVFANLQLTMTKVQRNLSKIQTTIDNGRDMLQDKISDAEKRSE